MLVLGPSAVEGRNRPVIKGGEGKAIRQLTSTKYRVIAPLEPYMPFIGNPPCLFGSCGSYPVLLLPCMTSPALGFSAPVF